MISESKTVCRFVVNHKYQKVGRSKIQYLKKEIILYTKTEIQFTSEFVALSNQKYIDNVYAPEVKTKDNKLSS